MPTSSPSCLAARARGLERVLVGDVDLLVHGRRVEDARNVGLLEALEPLDLVPQVGLDRRSRARPG